MASSRRLAGVVLDMAVGIAVAEGWVPARWALGASEE